MPKIPDATSIPRATPSLQRDIVTPNVSQVGAGGQSLAAGVLDLASGIRKGDMEERQGVIDDSELTATIAFENEANAYDQDQEFGTIVSRATGSLDEAIGTIASGITNPDDRENFVSRQQLGKARTLSRLGKVAWVKERDHNRGIIDTQLLDARETALTGDMGMISELVTRRIKSAVDKGYLSAEEAVVMTDNWRTSAATGRLDMMPPEQRAKALKAPWAEQLPSDTRAKYQREVEQQLLVGKAQARVDSLMADSPNVTLDEGRASIRAEITDPAERIATEARFKEDFDNRERARQFQQNSLYDKYGETMLEPGASVTSIPKEDWSAMSQAMRVNLKNLEAKPRTATDPAALQRVVQLTAQGRWGDVRKFISTNSSLLTGGDISKYTTAAEKGLAPNSVTDQQLIASVIPGNDPVDKELRNQMLVTMNNWRNNYTTNYGKEPTPEQAESHANRLLMDYDKDPSSWGYYDTSPIYQLEGRERDVALAKVHMDELELADAENFRMTREYLIAQGVEGVDRFEFEEAFNNQSLVTSVYRLNRPLYDDVADYFNQRGISPTHSQFLMAHDALLRQRNVK